MRINQLFLSDISDLLLAALESTGKIVLKVSGISMQPMLYNDRDTVKVVKSELPLKKYDLPIYRMDDGQYLMHRVVKVHKDGTYKCQGDNRWEPEDNIRNDQIIGIVKSFNRNGKQIDVDKSFGYWLYTRTWKFLHPFKKYYKYFKAVVDKFKGK